MAAQEFTLYDGTVSVKVKATDTSITLDFDTTDTEHDKPVISMLKFDHATTVSDKIRAAWAVIAQKSIPDATLGKMDSHLHLVGTFQPDQIADALAVVQNSLRHPAVNTPPTPKPTIQPPETDDAAPDIHREEDTLRHSAPQSFLSRLQTEKTTAQQRRTFRHWKLEDELDGITADVFPASDSLLTGFTAPDAEKSKEWVAVRITPGQDTVDARTEIARLLGEVEKKLISKGLSIKAARVYHGDEESGRQDVGVILVHAGKHPPETIATVNSGLEYVQENLHILKAKLGRGRGEDHHQRRSIPQEPDTLELELLSRMRAAAASGLITLHDQGDALKKWVKATAETMRDAARNQDDPPQARSA